MKTRLAFGHGSSSLAPLALLIASGTLFGCGVYGDERDRTSDGRSGEVDGTAQQAITGACTVNTFGLPCDPDGNGALGECDGVCGIFTTGVPGCVLLADAGMTTDDLNGHVCGDATGADCTKSCDEGKCKTKNATVGSACSALGGNACSGQCTQGINGATCVATLQGCGNMHQTGCTFQTCNAEKNNAGCIAVDLLKSTVCDDGDACTKSEVCDGKGSCEGTAVTCSAGCSCDSKTGDCTVGNCGGTGSTTSSTGSTTSSTSSGSGGAGGAGQGGATSTGTASTTATGSTTSTGSGTSSGGGGKGGANTGGATATSNLRYIEGHGIDCSVGETGSESGGGLLVWVAGGASLSFAVRQARRRGAVRG